MRIVRYALEIVDYQQLQPLWPGRVLSVGAHCYEREPGRYDDDPPGGYWRELPRDEYSIDIWCTDNEDKRPTNQLAPVLGVWIVGTGNPFPQAMLDADAMFHGTVDMRDASMGAWHVWSAIVGTAANPEHGYGEVSSIDDMVEKIKARHGRQAQ